jgi:hypothetical protein
VSCFHNLPLDSREIRNRVFNLPLDSRKIRNRVFNLPFGFTEDSFDVL